MNLGCIHSSTGSGLLICDESTADPREEPGLPSTSSGEPAELTKAIPQAPICLQVAHVKPFYSFIDGSLLRTWTKEPKLM